MKVEHLYGSSCVQAALKYNRRRITKLFTKTGLQSKVATRMATERSIPIVMSSAGQLDRLSGGRPNNGLVLEVSLMESTTIVSLDVCDPLDGQDNFYNINTGSGVKTAQLANGRAFPLWLCLDRIVDPQNLGSILRTAHFYAVDGIVMSQKNTSPLSPVVSRASAGAMETGDLYSTQSLSRFLGESKKNGWSVYGTDLKSKNVVWIEPFNTPCLLLQPTILLLGNEGKGHMSLANDSSLLVRSFQSTKTDVDSLNVSVAAGILIQSILNS